MRPFVFGGGVAKKKVEDPKAGRYCYVCRRDLTHAEDEVKHLFSKEHKSAIRGVKG